MTIALDGDVEALSDEGNIFIASGKTITIDLQGHKIDRKRSSAAPSRARAP